jgi:hypothetical protein
MESFETFNCEVCIDFFELAAVLLGFIIFNKFEF